MKNKKRITIGVVVVLLALAAILAVIMLKKFAPNKTHMSLTKYFQVTDQGMICLLYTSPSPRDRG